MEFEFDAEKSEANKIKHGIDFVEGQELWKDEDGSELSAKNVGEARYMRIGKAFSKLWSAIFTIRSSSIRIISIRRARESERDIYEKFR